MRVEISQCDATGLWWCALFSGDDWLTGPHWWETREDAERAGRILAALSRAAS